ncbi:Csu type fimbrial protein [Cedecea davisae]|uniref:Csu type fimbrial protein n=1 Tax=Cedecea davisae TaxID=158484 RepID=UPI00242F3722|nr:spore coat protein U domain-containing protein [Cedecea davisae]
MKVRYGIITMLFLLSGFIPKGQANSLVNFEFNQLCNVYWDHTGPIILSSFDKSGLDIQDGGNTSVDVPVDVFCLGRPDTLSDSDASFSMVVSSVFPKPWSGNDLVLTNEKPAEANEHYQIRANLCAGQSAGEISKLCVSTIGTPTNYVFPQGGDQKELVDSILGPNSSESTAMNKALCSAHPDECDSTYMLIHIGQREHPYRLQAHLIIPQQTQIAPGSYYGTYTIRLNGKLRGASLLGFSFVGMNISNVQQPLEFRLNVSSSCQVTPPTDVILPAQMFSGQSESQDALAQVRCTYGTPYTVTFKGSHTDNTGTEYLSISNGKNKIPYQILNDKGVRWDQLGEKFTGTSKKQPIHFKIKTLTGDENQPAGTYEDTVTMTVNYADAT